MLHPNLSVNEKGHLTIGGLDAVDLAAEFGTPAYIIDEDMVRENCRTYRRAMTRCFGDNSRPLYASKALCCAAMYHIAREEGLVDNSIYMRPAGQKKPELPSEEPVFYPPVMDDEEEEDDWILEPSDEPQKSDYVGQDEAEVMKREVWDPFFRGGNRR